LLPGGSHWGAVEVAPHFNKERWKLDPVAALIAGGIIGYAVRPDGKLEPIDYSKLAYALEGNETPFIRKIEIDTAVDRSTEELMEKFTEPGSALFIKNPSTPTLPVYIRFNSRNNDEFELTALRKIKGPYGCFYIRNEAGAGILTLYITKGFQFEFNESLVETTGTAMILNDISDVDLTGVADNDLLKYDAASGDWKPEELLAAELPSHATRHQDGGADEISIAGLSGEPADTVNKTGDQTIAGIKTFSSIPVLPASDPTADNEAARKAYVDSYPFFFAKFYEFIPWTSLDGFIVGGDTGYDVQPMGTYVDLMTGAIGDYDAKLYTKSYWYSLLDTGKIITFEFPLMFLSSISLQIIWLRLTSDPTDPPSELCNHIGWKIVGADLYASNADGAAQTITDTTIDLVADYQRTRLKVVLNPGTDCKFYVNDVLKVTHTTNLPDAADLLLHFHIRTGDTNKWIRIGRVLIEKEHA
jgi:hypothetical protein